MEALLSQQRTLITELNRVLRNYRCDGPDRKTKAYLEEKLKKFGDLFAQIRRNDDKLNPFIDHGQPYWAENMFANVDDLYRKVNNDILKRLSENRNAVDLLSESDDLENLDESLSRMEKSINNILINERDEVPPKQNGDVAGGSGEQNDQASKSSNGNGNIGVSNGDQSELNGNTTGNRTSISHIEHSQPNSSQSSTISNELMVPYEELMDFIFAAEELNTNSSKGVAQTHHDMLTTAWTEFRAVLQSERAAKRNIGLNYNIILQRYMSASGKLNDLLKSNSSVNPNVSSSVQFSLPTIKLPEFYGKSTEWKAFISLFDRMVHTNPRADDGMKIEYLKTCIKGDAARIINHLDATPENYKTCYDLLKKEYMIMGVNISSISIIEFESSESLKHLHDTVYESIMSIRNIGVSTENWNT